jgi:hypothetical protein
MKSKSGKGSGKKYRGSRRDLHSPHKHESNGGAIGRDGTRIGTKGGWGDSKPAV